MFWWKVIPDEKLPVPPKATSINMSALLMTGGLHLIGSDSLQVQNPMSTDNNKGGSIVSPLKHAINMVPKKDVPEGDVTISWDSKDYH